jgi:phosphatidylserine decarboxylase
MHYPLFRWFPKRGLTRLAGWLAERRRPRWLLRFAIRLYISVYRIDMRPFAGGPRDFTTFNEFFARPLRAGERPIDPRADAIVSPVDGKVSACGKIEEGRLIQAKGFDYSLEMLLGGDPAWREYLGGSYLTLYLAPPDYHRIHAPHAGAVTRFRYLPGEFWSVSPAGLNSVPHLYERNERLVTFLSAPFGESALIAVGAMIVGGIRVVYDSKVGDRGRLAGRAETLSAPFGLEKGAELGRFLLGSSVVLLFRPGEVQLEDRRAGDKVRMGQALGTIAHNSRRPGSMDE